LPKRALLPAEPPPNRPQISERAAVLPRTIRADGQEENKGKQTSQKHPNSFPSSGKGRVAVFPRIHDSMINAYWEPISFSVQKMLVNEASCR